MKKYSALLFTLLACHALFAQTKPYFQQEVNYRIAVTLDDKAHTISGTIEMEYLNNSPDELTEIWFHLWGNAFKNVNTAFAKQKLRDGSTAFYFAKDSDKGYYTGLDFMVDGEKATLQPDPENPDIALLKLPKPLKNKGKIRIQTPFTLKIPASWSRLGHVGTSYQITQWFPKPAVYDHQGWHPMPYLDLGEFYAEFGSFDVSITLPENYVVGSSGTLQTESERLFLQKKTAETKEKFKQGIPEEDPFPASSATMKTIRYTAERVHDFAWFADKRFLVQKSEVTLASGRKVDTWTMFSNEQAKYWEKSIGYVNRSVQFYSEKVGEYPHPQATAVHSALSAGGGMEYPMITVIGNVDNDLALDDVITHEVGHNWFQGILASNERDHAWLDEGINSSYEYRYMRQYYGTRVDYGLPNFILKSSDSDIYEAGFQIQARRRLDQTPALHSNDFTPMNYGLSAYVKPGSAMGHLEKYLGTEKFDAAMQAYYREWQFRHPSPEDFRRVLERESGKDLGWVFEGYIGSKKRLDYALENAHPSSTPGENTWKIRIKNRGEFVAPFPVTAMKDGKAVATQWYEGFEGEQELAFPAGDYDQFILDYEHVTLDVFRKNNNLKTSGLLKKIEPLRLKLLPGIEHSRYSTLQWLPAFGGNQYDGFMAGLAIYNTTVPAKKLEFSLVSMYGFASKDLVGAGNLQYNIFPVSEKIRKISLGVSSKAFHYRSPDSLRTETGFENTNLQYRRIVPYLRVELMRSPTSRSYQIFQLRSIWLQEQFADFQQDSVGTFYQGNAWEDALIHEFSWQLGNRRALNPYSLRLTLEQRRYDDPFGSDKKFSYLKAGLEYQGEYTYDHKRSMKLRVFAGKFLKNSVRERGFIGPGAFNLTSQGYNDYRYDDYYFGRTEASGSLSQQIMRSDGGMKVPLGSGYSEGRSNNFIFAINLVSDLPQDLPGKLPLKPYFDLGYFNDARPISSDLRFNDQVWWNGGVMLELGNGIGAVYFPVVWSKTLKGDDKLPGLLDPSGRDTFWKRISFTLNLNALNPWGMVERVAN